VSEKTVQIGHFATAMDAHFARGLLARRGIPAFVQGETTGTTWGFPVGIDQGIRLLVREEDVEAAAAVLEEAEEPPEDTGAHPPADPDDDPYADPVAAESPEADSVADPVDDGGAWARRVRAVAVLLIPMSFASVFWVRFAPAVPAGVLLFLLLSARARSQSTPAGRRAIAQAWWAFTVLLLLLAMGAATPVRRFVRLPR
jgi:hypothetical protein